jgi:hypothetical protein
MREISAKRYTLSSRNGVSFAGGGAIFDVKISEGRIDDDDDDAVAADSMLASDGGT